MDKLASLSWRYRRLLRAEAAHIELSVECEVWREGPEEGTARWDEEGLMRRKDNPFILDECVKLLRELRQQIEDTGVEPSRDEAIIKRIYGGSILRTTLLGFYSERTRSDRWREQDQNKLKEANEQNKVQILRRIAQEIVKIERDREQLPAQTVDATPPTSLIRQYFSQRTDVSELYSIKPKRDSAFRVY